MRTKYMFIAGIVFLASCSGSKKAAMSGTIDAKNPVVAHRGAFKKNGFPENSIASLKEAIRLKCLGSEFDIWMTADDSLVINHDPNYNKLPIEKTTYADLLKFPLSNGEKIPTLREYLLAGKTNNPSTRLICEVKPSASKERGKIVGEKVVKLVHELDLQHNAAYISFDYGILQKILEVNPRAHVQYLNGDIAPAQLKADKMSGLDYHFSVFKKHPEWIQEAKQLKLALNAWTVNEAADMDWLLKEGFEYITTNEPELLLEKVKAKP